MGLENLENLVALWLPGNLGRLENLVLLVRLENLVLLVRLENLGRLENLVALWLPGNLVRLGNPEDLEAVED